MSICRDATQLQRDRMTADRLDARQAPRARLVRTPARRHLRRLRGAGGRRCRPALRWPARRRPLRAHALERTDHTGASPAAAACMAMMQRAACSRRSACTCSTVHGEFAPEFRKADPRRRRRSALLGLRHLADRASAGTRTCRPCT